MSIPFKRLSLSAAIGTAFVAAPVAWAQSGQSSTPTGDQGIQQITVTAGKRPQLLTDIPQSVQAISGDKLQTDGVTSMSDIVQVVPGTSQTFKASPGFEVLQVRGISSGAVGDSLVGYYIDEIPFGLPNVQYIPPVNVFDLSRVEVLRGPQGTLYGQSSMGGAIRLITRKPDLSKFAGEARLGGSQVDGGFSGSKADVMLNVPVKEDVFGLRFTGGTSQEESYIANTGKQKNSNLRLKGLVAANPKLGVEFTLWGIQSRQTDYAYGQPTAIYKGITDPNEPRGVDTDVTLGNVTLNYDAGFADLVSATSYMDHAFTYKFGLPGLTNLQPGFGQWLSNNRVATQSLSQEVRLASKSGQGLNWIGGAFFQDAKLHITQQQGWAALKTFGLGPTVYTEGFGDLKTRSLGLFGEMSAELMGGKLVPTIGVRLYRDERTLGGVTDGVSTNASRTFQSANPRFNLAYKPAGDTLYYLNIAKGFRSGAQQSQGAVTAARAAGLPADLIMPQDSLWSYEGGAKWDIAKRVAIEVAAYAIDWKDAQITNLLVGKNGVTTTVISGGNNVKGQGLDLGIALATPVDGLTITLAGNVNQTEFTKVPSATTAKVGAQIPGSPKQSASLGATYRTPVGSGLMLLVNGSYNYRGTQSEMTTGKSSDSLRDLRLRLGVSGRTWDASLYGQNLNDQRGVAAVLSAAAVNPIQPRKLGVDLNVKF